jgi:hypothetical protein
MLNRSGVCSMRKLFNACFVGALITLALLMPSAHVSAGAPEAFFDSEGGEALLGPDIDWVFLDSYLTTWDRFARGENYLSDEIGKGVKRFNAELARALRRDPKKAMGRAIMYPLLQVGGFVPLESAVGKELTAAFGQNAPPVSELREGRYYFAGDLYFWWEEHRKEFGPYQLYDDWRVRPFAKEKVIPMYRSVREQSGTDGKK